MVFDNFFQTRSAKAVSINIIFGSFFSRFSTIFISHNDFIAFFETVEFLSIFDCCKCGLFGSLFGSFSLSGQISKTLVMSCNNFFQAQTFKVVGFNIGCSCFFFGNLAIFINVVDGVFFFETVDILGIFVGSK